MSGIELRHRLGSAFRSFSSPPLMMRPPQGGDEGRMRRIAAQAISLGCCWMRSRRPRLESAGRVRQVRACAIEKPCPRRAIAAIFLADFPLLALKREVCAGGCSSWVSASPPLFERGGPGQRPWWAVRPSTVHAQDYDGEAIRRAITSSAPTTRRSTSEAAHRRRARARRVLPAPLCATVRRRPALEPIAEKLDAIAARIDALAQRVRRARQGLELRFALAVWRAGTGSRSRPASCR